MSHFASLPLQAVTITHLGDEGPLRASWHGSDSSVARILYYIPLIGVVHVLIFARLVRVASG